MDIAATFSGGCSSESESGELRVSAMGLLVAREAGFLITNLSMLMSNNEKAVELVAIYLEYISQLDSI